MTMPLEGVLTRQSDWSKPFSLLTRMAKCAPPIGNLETRQLCPTKLINLTSFSPDILNKNNSRRKLILMSFRSASLSKVMASPYLLVQRSRCTTLVSLLMELCLIVQYRVDSHSVLPLALDKSSSAGMRDSSSCLWELKPSSTVPMITHTESVAFQMLYLQRLL